MGIFMGYVSLPEGKWFQILVSLVVPPKNSGEMMEKNMTHIGFLVGMGWKQPTNQNFCF